MKRRRTVMLQGAPWVFLAVGSLLTLAAWPTPVEAQQQASATISAVTGRVEVPSKGQTVALARGQIITRTQGQPMSAPNPATPANHRISGRPGRR